MDSGRFLVKKRIRVERKRGKSLPFPTLSVLGTDKGHKLETLRPNLSSKTNKEEKEKEKRFAPWTESLVSLVNSTVVSLNACKSSFDVLYNI